MTAALPLQIPATREVTTLRFGVLDVPLDDLIQFADGLPGFDTITSFVLLPIRPGLAWLQAADMPALALLMVESSHITDRPELNGSWAVVTLGNTPADASANLLAPVWINPAIGTGHQEIRPDLGGSTTHPVDLGAI